MHCTRWGISEQTPCPFTYIWLETILLVLVWSGSVATSIKVSIWCRPLNGRQGLIKIPNNAPSLIDGAPLRGVPVRLPMEVIHKLCLIHKYKYKFPSKQQNLVVQIAYIFFHIVKCSCQLRSPIEVIYKLCPAPHSLDADYLLMRVN